MRAFPIDRNGSGPLEFYCYKLKAGQLLFSIGPADDPSGPMKSEFLPAQEVLQSPLRERFCANDLALMDERFAAIGANLYAKDPERYVYVSGN